MSIPELTQLEDHTLVPEMLFELAAVYYNNAKILERTYPELPNPGCMWYLMAREIELAAFRAQMVVKYSRKIAPSIKSKDLDDVC